MLSRQIVPRLTVWDVLLVLVGLAILVTMPISYAYILTEAFVWGPWKTAGIKILLYGTPFIIHFALWLKRSARSRSVCRMLPLTSATVAAVQPYEIGNPATAAYRILLMIPGADASGSALVCEKPALVAFAAQLSVGDTIQVLHHPRIPPSSSPSMP